MLEPKKKPHDTSMSDAVTGNESNIKWILNTGLFSPHVFSFTVQHLQMVSPNFEFTQAYEYECMKETLFNYTCKVFEFSKS